MNLYVHMVRHFGAEVVLVTRACGENIWAAVLVIRTCGEGEDI